MRPLHYILDENKRPVPCADPIEWARWNRLAGEKCRVAFTELGDGIAVSTVFMGFEHRLWGSGLPILFETMAFSDFGESTMIQIGSMDRYCTWDDAQKGHELILRDVRLQIDLTHVSAADAIAAIMVRDRA